jgi:hypothetical protein
MKKRGIEHIEIPAKGRAELAKFYAEMFGWEIESNEEMHYTLWEAGNLNGGFTDVDDGMYKPGDVVIYIESDDIEADLKKIAAMGGKTVHEKMEIPGVGWFAMFTDPTGNRMALFKGLPRA